MFKKPDLLYKKTLNNHEAKRVPEMKKNKKNLMS
jgi:hypothetical protein